MLKVWWITLMAYLQTLTVRENAPGKAEHGVFFLFHAMSADKKKYNV